MLSISNVSDSKAAGGYYEQKDDYYSGGQREGAWFGQGAATLGLNGPVDRVQFIELLAGRLPNGTQIHRAAGGHRGGLDMTFSAPKSVSLMALLAGDQRVTDAHTKAVAATLKIAERLAGYRATEGGLTEHRNSANVVGAQFTHELSRACDPQLHTHCVVMNITQRNDGQWRALDNELLYRSKMMLGAAYRAELAKELQTLGYQINVTHNDGRFELAGWDNRVLKEFSQRSQAIEEFLRLHKDVPSHASATEKKMAAVATRAMKEDVDRDALSELWLARLAELGAEVPSIPNATDDLNKTDLTSSAKNAIDRAINHLSERESAFTKDQLTCAALQFGVGETTHDNVVFEISGRINQGSLNATGSLLTTPELQRQESELLRAEIDERHVLPALGGRFPLEKAPSLTLEQAMAVQVILESTSRLVGMVGKAGTGKTTTLKVAVDSLKSSRIKVYGVAPSSNASRLLSEAGLQTSTVAAFIANGMHQKVAKGGVLIVDESGMLSTKQIKTLHEQSRLHDFRLVLVGDPRQLAAVEAGKPFAQLIAAGMPTSTLRQIHRQKNQTLKSAVECAAEGDIGNAVAAISHCVTETPEREQRHEDISAAYAALSHVERAETIVVSGTRASRERINQLIRTKLQLAGTGVVVQTLEKKDMTKEQAASISSYEVNDVLIANREYKMLGLKRGDQAQVVGISATAVRLSDSTGRTFEWWPTRATDLTASRIVEREISVDERVRVTSNMHNLGLLNGDEFRVVTLDSDSKTCMIELPDGTNKQLDLSAPLPIDHAYCKTVYASQGATCDRVFVEADTASLTANRATFYVAISRARSEVKIFTNDADALGSAMSRSMDKTSALDVRAPEDSFDIGID